MNGISRLLRDRLGQALQDARLFTPNWIYAWEIHTDDRPEDQNDSVDLFLSGKRMVVFTIDKKEHIITMEHCIQNVMEMDDACMICSICQGTFDREDISDFLQHAFFGEILFPEVDRIIPHDAPGEKYEEPAHC